MDFGARLVIDSTVTCSPPTFAAISARTVNVVNTTGLSSAGPSLVPHPDSISAVARAVSAAAAVADRVAHPP